MLKMIVMLTKDDCTVANAVDVLKSIAHTGIKHVGFKDVGIEPSEMKHLMKIIRSNDMKAYFETVQLTKDKTLRSVDLALELGADYLMGGKFVESVLPEIKEEKISYYPYVGKIHDHPCLMNGSLQLLKEELSRYEELGVDGTTILAYRYQNGIEELFKLYKKVAKKPCIVAGDVDSIDKIKHLNKIKIEAFTIGTALFNCSFTEGKSLLDQILYLQNELESLAKNEQGGKDETN